MEKPAYDPPAITIIEFDIHDSIASSMDHGPNVSCSEAVFE